MGIVKWQPHHHVILLKLTTNDYSTLNHPREVIWIYVLNGVGLTFPSYRCHDVECRVLTTNPSKVHRHNVHTDPKFYRTFYVPKMPLRKRKIFVVLITKCKLITCQPKHRNRILKRRLHEKIVQMTFQQATVSHHNYRSLQYQRQKQYSLYYNG